MELEAFRQEVARIKAENPKWGRYRIAQHLNAPPAKVQRALNWINKNRSTVSGQTEMSEEYNESKGTGCITTKSLNIKTVDEALDYADVDRDVWDVDRFVINSWEVTMSGLKSSTKQDTTYTNWQVKVWLKKKVKVFDVNEVIDLMKDHAPNYKAIVYKKLSQKIMQEISIPDLHYGKYCWGEETGQDYDKSLAEQAFIESLSHLLSMTKNYKPELFLFPLGNDFFHIDNLDGTTTKGTRQDFDDRATMLFGDGLKLIVSAVDMLCTLAPVEILICPGNHDQQTIFHLGTALEAWYRICPNVLINNSPKVRKYKLYGKNLIGFVHGSQDDVPEKDLPLQMALEQQKEGWHDAEHMEWHIGHKHHRAKKTYLVHGDFNNYKGVIVRRLASLTGRDFWHYQRGYVSSRAAETLLWDYDRGYSGEFITYI